jgi:hypothetical protein
MGQYVLLLAGVAIGGIIAAGIGAFAEHVKNRAIREKSEWREKIIASVEEKWVDVENLVRLYRSGRLNSPAFRESMEEKIGSINRLYKPSIHQLDIFFVKYTEKLIAEYSDMDATAVPPKVTAPPTPENFEDKAPPLSLADEMPGVPVPEIDFPVREGEQIISEMTDTAFADDNIQLESFLEMEPGSSTPEICAPVRGSEAFAREEETKGPVPDAGLDPEMPTGIEGFPPLSPEEFAEQQQAVPREDILLPEAPSSFGPPPSSGSETGSFDVDGSETIIQPPDNQNSFSGMVSSEQPVEPVPLPSMQQPPRTQPFSLPSRSRVHKTPPTPSFAKDKPAKPATIYDVEAETIIVDRSTIIDAQQPETVPQPEDEKKSIGITGEDVSDTFDKFFGLGAK